MKKIKILLLTLLFLIPFQTNAIVEKGDQIFVTDEADLLSEESEEYLISYSEFLYKQKKIDYYVVTVKNLENLEIEEYSEQLFSNFHISDRGILILLSEEDREIRIQRGEEIENLLSTDSLDNYIANYFIPYMQQGKWDYGLINGYSAIYKDICEKYGIDASSMEVVEDVDFLTKYGNIFLFIMVWLVVFFASRIAKVYKKMKRKEKITDGEIIEVAIILLLNIFLLSFSYILKPINILLLFLLEAVMFYSSTATKENRKTPNKKTFQKETIFSKEKIVFYDIIKNRWLYEKK